VREGFDDVAEGKREVIFGSFFGREAGFALFNHFGPLFDRPRDNI
jgi:hypothetical protein